MRSRETSATPTTISERPSTSQSQVQYNTQKLFQKKTNQQTAADGPKEAQPKAFFHNYKAQGRLASALIDEQAKEQNLSASFVETSR